MSCSEGSVLPVERRPLSARTSDLFGVEFEPPVLAPDELYASKLVAALDRQHPATCSTWQLYESGDISDGMVECFVIYLAGHNRPPHEVLFGNDKGHRRRARAGLCRHDRKWTAPWNTARRSRQAAARAATTTERRAQAVSEHPIRASRTPGVPEETTMAYKENGCAAMTDTSLVRARGVRGRCGASPTLSMVRESSATVVSTAMCIPFERSSRNRRFPLCRCSWTRMEQMMAMRKRTDTVFPNAAGIDVGASSHWVAVPPDAAEESVREFGVMTDDLRALADWLMACKVEIVALESTGVLDPAVRDPGAARTAGLAGRCATDEVRARPQE